MQEALDIVRRSRHIVITGHVHADGDCLGAEALLYHAFRGLGKEVTVINPDAPDARYAVLAAHTPYRAYSGPHALPDHDALFACDFSMPGRMGPMAEEIRRRAGARVAVDHHVLEPADRAFWSALVHDPRAPATGVLAYRLALALEVALPLPALEAGFVALSADTGWFRYPNAGAEAWSLAADWVAAGVRPDVLHDAIHQHNDPGLPRGLAAGLESLEYDCGGRLALAWLSQERLAQVRGSLEDSDPVLDILRSVASVEVVAFVYERAGRVQASLRSKSDVDVNVAARALGGGGHPKAAGVTFPPATPLHAALAQVRAALRAALAPASAPV
ncbi:MAG: hypothetical protein EYC70_14470 [Planctomycetota bacterium]|nr:MAG: hypothetical protein EYC70_14470 [Planctomycetota bacterium]